MRLHIKFLNLVVYVVLAAAFAKGFNETAGPAIPYFINLVKAAIADSAAPEAPERGERGGAESDELRSMLASLLQSHGFSLDPEPDPTIDEIRKALRGACRNLLAIVYEPQGERWRGAVVAGFRKLDSIWRKDGNSTYEVYRKRAEDEVRHGGGPGQNQRAAKRLHKLLIATTGCREDLRRRAVERGFDAAALAAEIDR